MLSPELRERARIVSIKAARAVVSAYYANDNPTGGNLHIVTDEGGVEDSSIEFCIDDAKRYSDDAAVAIGEMLLAFPLDDRRLICADFRDEELVAFLGSADA